MAGFVIGLVLLYTGVINTIMLDSGITALCLTLVDAVLVHIAIEYSFKKSNQAFMLIGLGGMLFSMFFMLVAILILLIFLNIDTYAFILVFFIFYVVTMVHKVYHFNKLKS